MKKALFLLLGLSALSAIEASRVLEFKEWRSYVNGSLEDPHIKVKNQDGQEEDLIAIVREHGTPEDEAKVLKALQKGNFDL